MRKLILALALILVSPMSAFAWVENPCPQGTSLQPLGVGNRTESITTVGADVYAIGWQCTSTACTFGLYDSDDPVSTLADVAEGQIKFEAGQAASAGDYVEIGPLYFKEGISVVGANLAGVIPYGCRQR
jgi:hypothetical protein